MKTQWKDRFLNNRIVEVNSYGLSVVCENEQILIKNKKEVLQKIPAEDIAVLILSNNSIDFSGNVVNCLLKNKASIIFCDEKFLPMGIIYPFSNNNLHTEILKTQIDISEAKLKRIWKQIVVEKIKSQSTTLKKTFGYDAGVLEIKDKILSGDYTNYEAYASKRYWGIFFSREIKLKRNKPNAEDFLNVYLNYGYIILRAIMCRAICSAGLNPSIGIHHCNRFNQFCLADDLIEPFRTVVDNIVYEIVYVDRINEFSKEGKLKTMTTLASQFNIKRGKETGKSLLFTVFSEVAHQYVRYLKDQNCEIDFPIILEPIKDETEIAV